MGECLFCQIAAGTLPSKLVHQDEQAVAFEDINPQAPVHVLVIPRKHVASLGEAEAEDGALLTHLLRVCVDVAKAKGLGASGYRVLTNTGRGAGQSVFHLHWHVLGGRPLGWPPG